MTEATATDIALTVDGIWSKRGLISAYLLMCDSLAGAGGGGGWVGDNRAKRGGYSRDPNKFTSELINSVAFSPGR